MSRKSSRIHILNLIFQKEFHNSFDACIESELYLNEIDNLSNKDKDFILNEFSGIIKNLNEIDEHIKSTSLNWSIDRINKADLAILRIAIFEMLYQTDIPISVSINEAVELSKQYGGNSEDDSHTFINGILAKVAKNISASMT